ncbi:hypothetical protein [Microbulbifer marinus]|uniref:TIGR04255 family protein n=1 Tax=Microbulbifer marinus TaxID=658218 RepID=A0A1H3Z409_9GAMM|nr:hypothetical protein [Microbulbifer marinus]SEA18583.1 hypothetical protein SAMN05216562_2184 [Microbulbifer marinus]
MDKLHETHQLHFFTSNVDVQATPQQISSMLSVLGGFGLVPTFGHELNASNAEKRQFVVMVSVDEKIRIEFPIGRIVILGEGGEATEFFNKACAILQELYKLFPTKEGNRLSLISTKIFSGSEQEFDELYRQLFTYRTVRPFEWDNRIAERQTLQNCGEEINNISTIRRCNVASPFINGGKEFNAILSEIDTNTIHENKKLRFNLDNAKDVFKDLHLQNEEANALLKRYFDK